jgi:hypothetical protein
VGSGDERDQIKDNYLRMLSIKYKDEMGQAQLAHAYTPSYSGGRDQEDRDLPRQMSTRPCLEKNHHKKKGWWSSSRCRP